MSGLERGKQHGRQMNILLTGASGFLGRNFILSAPNTWRILALYCHDASFPGFLSRTLKTSVTAVRCDLADPMQVKSMLDRYGHEWECCVYLAAKVDIPWSVKEPRQDLLINAGSLLNLLEGLRANRFIFMSSGAVYDGLQGEVCPRIRVNPTIPYAISKLACEQYVQYYHHRRRTLENFLILRFWGAYGPYEAPHKIYTRLIRTFVLEGKDTYTIYGDGCNLIDAMYVDDAIEGLQSVLTGYSWNSIVDFAACSPMTVKALVHEVGRILGLKRIRVETHGAAPEDIQFRPSAEQMRKYYSFQPKFNLREGIERLRDFLIKKDGQKRNRNTAAAAVRV
jgi:UDP-glucose 4-epimerase